MGIVRQYNQHTNSDSRRNKKMNIIENIYRIDDPDMRGAEAAMLRAAQNARDEARKAGVKIPIWQNNAVVWKHPDELEALVPPQESV
jgi:hypothetical protein